ncbi:hypothetical protein [Priestia megaterium]|uniref:hypothetical protein n=1 Tax=Priestia megaterium TaxID=1404 RepID=UPI00366E9A0A
MKQFICLILAIGFLFSGTPIASAYSDTRPALYNFVHSLTRMGSEQAEKYVAQNVYIPEIREDTPLRNIQGLPSSKENEQILIGYFNDGKATNERIAFIWKVAFTKTQITDINEVYNGSNPFMNEFNAIKKYEKKFHVDILKPTAFPFEITHIDTQQDNDTLIIRYRNDMLSGLFQLKVTENNNSLEDYKGIKDVPYTLKNGTKALYQPNYFPAKQLLFQRGKLIYTIGISKATKKYVTANDLLKIANSMISN